MAESLDYAHHKSPAPGYQALQHPCCPTGRSKESRLAEGRRLRAGRADRRRPPKPGRRMTGGISWSTFAYASPEQINQLPPR
ncbi:MAG: hypothetical protein R3F11_14925 [Verrucomicrobiales bacterium]